MPEREKYPLTQGAKEVAKKLIADWDAGIIEQTFYLVDVTAGKDKGVVLVAGLGAEDNFVPPPVGVLHELSEYHLIRLHIIRTDWERYEVTLLQELRNAVESDFGSKTEHSDADDLSFTTPELISTLIELIKPQRGELIYDPACGVASLLLQAKAYIELHHRLSSMERQRLNMHTLYGREIQLKTFQYARENFGREGLNQANLWHGNTLLKETYTPGFPQLFDVVMSNAPFGDQVTPEEQANFPVQTRFKELLFLQHAIESLKPGGRCAIVMPDGVISRTEPEYREVKRRLLAECEVHRVVQIADSVAPFARIQSSILYFTKGKLTEKVLYFRPDERPVEIQRETIESRFYDLTPPDDAPIAENIPENTPFMGDGNKYRIFISYRRDDSAWPAGRLYDYLTHNLDARIFMDRPAISPGEVFTDVIETALTSCDVLIVMIASKWLDIRDKHGNRRLDQEYDLVRREVATALEQGKVVIPVLVDGTFMPSQDELPPNLRELSLRNACTLSITHFDHEAEIIARRITDTLYLTGNH